MKILQWFIATLGLSMILIGFVDRRDGLAIGGSILIGSAMIVAVLPGSKRE